MTHTMDDVAKLAGVSAATVSRVLSKNPNISPATVERVMAAVEELGYFRNVHARRLAIGQSDLFGLVISEIANPFFSEIIGGFQTAAWDRGFDVLLLNTEYNPKRTDAVVRKLIESDVRGVAILTSSIHEKIIASLAREEIAVVCNHLPPGRLVSHIAIQYELGIIEAIEHVAQLGHRRAAVIAGPPTNRTANTIRDALVRGLRERGLDPHPVTHSDYHLDAGASAVQSILTAKHAPTVIFCGSDLIAMGAMVALEQAGLNVPNDISVVGIDDIAFAFLARPPLTTIRVAREQLGMICFQALDNLLKRKTRRGAEYALETHLVIRKSTAGAPKVLPRTGSKRAINQRASTV